MGFLMSRLLFAWAQICRRNIQILAWRLLSTVAPATPRATTASAQHDGLGHVPTNEEATTRGGSTVRWGVRTWGQWGADIMSLKLV